MFKFIERNDFMHKKLASRKECYLNPNNRRVGNIVVKTVLEGNEIMVSLPPHIRLYNCSTVRV